MEKTFSIVVNGVTVKKGVQESNLGKMFEFYRDMYPVQSVTATPEHVMTGGDGD